jgi:hypothetical protein
MSNLVPPSANLLRASPVLRERLAVAIREVDLLRRLIRLRESVGANNNLPHAASKPPVEEMAVADA